MMTVTRQIVGYDPETDRVAFEHSIPEEIWKEVIPLVKRNKGDPSAIFNYALDIGVANDIMVMVGQRGAQNLKYFLECEAAD